MFPSRCVADIKSSIFVFSLSWVIGNTSCLLPRMSDQATRFLLPSPEPGMSLFPLFVYLNPTCLKDRSPPWSLHSRMHVTPVFVSQVGALISPCTGFCFLCLTVPGYSGHKGMVTDSLDETVRVIEKVETWESKDLVLLPWTNPFPFQAFSPYL